MHRLLQILAVSIVLARTTAWRGNKVRREEFEDPQLHYHHKMPPFLKNVSEDARWEFYQITRDLTTSMNQKMEKIRKWAEEQKVSNNKETLELIREAVPVRAACSQVLTSEFLRHCREVIKEDLEKRRAEVLAEAAEVERSIRYARRDFACSKTRMTALRETSIASRRGMEKIIYDFYSDLFDSQCPLASSPSQGRQTCHSRDSPVRSTTCYHVGNKSYGTRSRQNKTRTPEEPSASTHQHPGEALYTLPDGMQGEYKLRFCLTFIDLKKASDSVEMEAVMKALSNRAVLIHHMKDAVEKWFKQMGEFWKDVDKNTVRVLKELPSAYPKVYEIWSDMDLTPKEMYRKFRKLGLDRAVARSLHEVSMVVIHSDAHDHNLNINMETFLEKLIGEKFDKHLSRHHFRH
ncbi:hypothetical protein RB195_014557 [Necator americanus]|uniref:SXP/RAL-2 family protein Ani s 5-like cation-binding domain-containing protein n=1 Tax=Necator americanus TaxID=51031 RepID=A0ABR1E0P4_NECAM